MVNSEVWHPRALASLAGQAAFAYQAVRLAPKFVKELHLALAGKLSWNDVLPRDELTTQRITAFVQHVRRFNGLRLLKRPVSLVVAADYSSVHGFGAFVVGEEPGPDGRMIVGLTDQEQAAVAENELSSTLGELKAKWHVVQWLAGHPKYGALVRHGHILFEGDNRGAEAVLARFAGGKKTFPVVAEIVRCVPGGGDGLGSSCSCGCCCRAPGSVAGLLCCHLLCWLQ